MKPTMMSAVLLSRPIDLWTGSAAIFSGTVFVFFAVRKG
jgi:hypothetical protein